MNQATVDDYRVLDPRAEGYTLEDAKNEEERRRRKGAAPTVRAYDPESRDRGSNAARGSGGPTRGSRGGRGGGMRSREYSDKAEARDWKGQSERDRKDGGRRA